MARKSFSSCGKPCMPMKDKQWVGRLGLAMRAGQVVSGDFAVEKLLRGEGAALVLLDADASDNTRKKISDACAHRGIPLAVVETGLLGRAIGKPGRIVAAVKTGDMGTNLRQLVLARNEND